MFTAWMQAQYDKFHEEVVVVLVNDCKVYRFNMMKEILMVTILAQWQWLTH